MCTNEHEVPKLPIIKIQKQEAKITSKCSERTVRGLKIWFRYILLKCSLGVPDHLYQQILIPGPGVSSVLNILMFSSLPTNMIN